MKAMLNIQNRKQKRKFFIVTADLRVYFCYSRKISKMSLHGDNNKTLAHKLKITPSAFSRKINGSSNFTIEEMKFIRKKYRLSDIEFLDIFFNN